MPLPLRAAERWSARSNAVATFSLLPGDIQLSGRVRNRLTMRLLTPSDAPGQPPKPGCRFESCRPCRTKAPLRRGFQVRRSGGRARAIRPCYSLAEHPRLGKLLAASASRSAEWRSFSYQILGFLDLPTIHEVCQEEDEQETENQRS
jgi:hypothetical protein